MDTSWQVAQRSPGEDGTWVGLIGATVVAVWFLILDVAAGHPLRTPSVLGQVLLMGRDRPDVATTDFTGVILYTAFHMVVFLAFGFVLAYLVRWALSNHFIRYALIPLFLAFALFFVVVVLMLGEETRSLFPVWSVLAANTLAALCMGYYLWRNHPELRRALQETPLGAAPGT